MAANLLFGCIHAPYHKQNAIEFLLKTQREYKCNKTIICTGDFFDFHAMSRHNTETDSPGVEEEYRRAKKFAAQFAKAFPFGILVQGNHDVIPQRQMTEIGLALSMLKTDTELYGLPKTWQVKRLFHVIPDKKVLVEHGINSGGKFGSLNTAIFKRTSYVQSHIHSAGGVMYSSNYNSTIFGMNVGCLCDESSLAMRYGQFNKAKGILGCGVVCSEEEAYFVKMRDSRKVTEEKVTK